MPGNIVNLTPEAIAQWPKPNYIDPVDRKWLTPFTCVVYAAATVLVALRLWLRSTKQAGRVGADDVMLALTWVAGTLFTAFVIVTSTKYHVGRHAWDIPIDDFQYIVEITWILEFLFLVTGCFLKISVLLFYRRLVVGSYENKWKWAVMAAIAFTAAYTLAFILALIFNCNPTESYWMSFNASWAANHSYKCATTTVINLLAGICAAVSDLYAVILPMIMTRSIDLPRPQRIALNILFSLGLIVVVVSAVRTYYLYAVGHHLDVTFYVFGVFVSSHIELQLGIMCAAAPALRVFFRKYLGGHVRAAYGSRTLTSQQEGHSESGLAEDDTQKAGALNPHYQEDHLSAKRLSKASNDGTVIAETEVGPPSSTLSSRRYTIKTPADYEAYNLRNMEQFRESARTRSDSRSQRAASMSQPFGPSAWDATSNHGQP